MTVPMSDRVAALRQRINASLPCETLVVDRADYEAVEDYLSALQREQFCAWQAAGSPEDWSHPLGIVWAGKHDGVLFKGVELIIGDVWPPAWLGWAA